MRNAILPNAAYARFLKLISVVFLIVGLLVLLERVWTLGADFHARRTWPVAEGRVVSARQADDSDLSRRSGSLSGHTQYWVEYEVSFALPPDRCRTGIIYEGPSETMPCHGVVRTRSTQSTAEVFQWFLHGYQLNQPVKVLWNPRGMTNTDIKIVGESVWLRYNFPRLILSLIWVLGFGSLYVFSQRQLAYFTSHPEEQRAASQDTPQDKDKFTSLDLS